MHFHAPEVKLRFGSQIMLSFSRQNTKVTILNSVIWPLSFLNISGSQHRKSLSSPEPMSTGGDSERSRSPSPAKDDQDEPPTGSPLGGSGLDNVILQTTTSVSSSISGPLPVTGSSISTLDSAALVTTTATTTTEAASEHNCNFEATHNHNNANDTNDNNFVASQHNSADSTAQNIINGQDNR